MSTTVIDALLVTLGLDASAFDKGVEKAVQAQKKIEDAAVEGGAATDKQEKKTEAERKKRTEKQGKEQSELEKKDKDAREKRGKDIEVKSKQAAQGFARIRNEALSLFAVFTAGVGIKGFLENAIGAAAGLDRMSANLGMSARDLSMWQLANERAGGSVEGMTAQLKQAASDISRFRMGQGVSESLQMSIRYGINPAEVKDANDLLLKQADILARMYAKSPTEAMEAARLMGISEDTFNLLKQGSAVVDQQRLAQSRLADEMAKNAPAAEDFRKKWNDVTHDFQAMGVKVLPKLIPQLERFASWVASIIPSVERFAGKVDNVVESMGGWTTVLVALGALKLLAMTSGLTALASALVGVGTALGVIGGAAGVAALATLTGVGLLTASAGLNKGEDAELARRRKMAPTIDGPGQPVKPSGTASVMSRLTELGWTQAQAAGITASFIQESNLNHEAVNPKSGARGIGQWLGSRVDDFKKWAGIDLKDSTARQQIDFFHHEVTSGKEQAAGRKLRATTTAEDAARVHSEAYERPGKDEANNERRMRLASEINAQASLKNAQAAANMPTGAAVAQGGGGNRSTSTSTAETHINGPITINTQATDAAGIAKAFGGEIGKYGFVAQMNTGLS